MLLVAVARTSWQVPLLVFALLQYALHVINHLWDVADSDPGVDRPGQRRRRSR